MPEQVEEIACGDSKEIDISGFVNAEDEDPDAAERKAYDLANKDIAAKLGKLQLAYRCKGDCNPNPSVRLLEKPKITIGTTGYITRTRKYEDIRFRKGRFIRFEDYTVYVYELSWKGKVRISC
jgi:hypothetical protein